MQMKNLKQEELRRRRTTKPKVEPSNNNPFFSIGVLRPSSQILGFHWRGLVDSAPQQPKIINIQPSQDVEKL